MADWDRWLTSCFISLLNELLLGLTVCPSLVECWWCWWRHNRLSTENYMSQKTPYTEPRTSFALILKASIIKTMSSIPERSREVFQKVNGLVLVFIIFNIFQCTCADFPQNLRTKIFLCQPVICVIRLEALMNLWPLHIVYSFYRNKWESLKIRITNKAELFWLVIPEVQLDIQPSNQNDIFAEPSHVNIWSQFNKMSVFQWQDKG